MSELAGADVRRAHLVGGGVASVAAERFEDGGELHGRCVDGGIVLRTVPWVRWYAARARSAHHQSGSVLVGSVSRSSQKADRVE